MWCPKWLKQYREQLQVPRRWAGELSAVYWEGTPESNHPVEEISMKGAKVKTSTLWPPGTMILIALRHHQAGVSEEQCFTNLWSQVISSDKAGIDLAFAFETPTERRNFRRFLKSLEGQSGGPSEGSEDERAVWRPGLGHPMGHR